MTSETSLGALAEQGVLVVTDGYRTRRDQLVHDGRGAPILRVSHVQDGYIEVDKTDEISLKYESRFVVKRAVLHDVVITTKGTVGRAAWIPEEYVGHVYSPQVCMVRSTDRLTVDPRWLYCWVRSPEMQHQLDRFSGQTDMAPYVKLKDLRSFTITLPPIDEQRATAEVLGALDDRIEYLSQRQQLGYQLQDALFEKLALDVSGRRQLGELVTLDKGVSYKGAHVVEDAAALPLINLGNFGRGRAPRWDNLKRYDGGTKPRHLVRPGDVVVCATDMTHDRVVLGKALVVPDKLKQAGVTHHLYALRLLGGGPVSRWLVALALNHEPIRRKVATYANGTTVLSLPRDALQRVEVPVPSMNELAKFDEAVESLQRLIEQAGREAASLRRGRDLLLPRMLSGDLRIEDPSRLLGEVA